MFRASSVAQKYNCQLTRLDFQQEQGLVSALPLGVNQIKIQRGPYHFRGGRVRSLHLSGDFSTGGEALYYGLNATSGNMILADRKQAENAQRLDPGNARQRQEFLR